MTTTKTAKKTTMTISERGNEGAAAVIPLLPPPPKRPCLREGRYPFCASITIAVWYALTWPRPPREEKEEEEEEEDNNCGYKPRSTTTTTTTKTSLTTTGGWRRIRDWYVLRLRRLFVHFPVWRDFFSSGVDFYRYIYDLVCVPLLLCYFFNSI